jgi:hypothetical protein
VDIDFRVYDIGGGVLRATASAFDLQCAWQGYDRGVEPAWRVVFTGPTVRLEIYDKNTGVLLAWGERVHLPARSV